MQKEMLEILLKELKESAQFKGPWKDVNNVPSSAHATEKTEDLLSTDGLVDVAESSVKAQISHNVSSSANVSEVQGLADGIFQPTGKVDGVLTRYSANLDGRCIVIYRCFRYYSWY